MAHVASPEIERLIQQYGWEDFQNFRAKRRMLNILNFFCIHFFYLVQAASLFTGSIALAYGNQTLHFAALGLQLVATLIIVFEKIYNNVLNQLLAQMQAIRNGTYLDESILVEVPDGAAPSSLTTSTGFSAKPATVAERLGEKNVVAPTASKEEQKT